MMFLKALLFLQSGIIFLLKPFLLVSFLVVLQMLLKLALSPECLWTLACQRTTYNKLVADPVEANIAKAGMQICHQQSNMLSKVRSSKQEVRGSKRLSAALLEAAAVAVCRHCEMCRRLGSLPSVHLAGSLCLDDIRYIAYVHPGGSSCRTFGSWQSVHPAGSSSRRFTVSG